MVNSPLQADLNETVRKYIAEATGLDVDDNVINGNDNHASPNSPYATVLEISKQGSGIDSEVAREGPTSITKTLMHQGRRIITYSVQFYKDGAADYAEMLLGYAATTPGQIWLGENELTWGIAGEVRNLDAVMGSKNEQRRSVDITFRYQSKRQLDINAIDSVEIEINLSAESDLQETVEVEDA